ncbi:hypothetical protein [Streptomyces sp. NBC_00038]|uniref:hypothetical protein n=1 Tax=Streptomyces sp. NBC_00038 TaxID=2903615 RepID=UPI0022588257|nr:hypothetical protein [Streptomyces sp. NBC_00038]MCX5555362.1 hypothetical protein [Streptomyces sp. NBC_00038]
MVDAQSQPRHLTSFVLPETGCLEETGNPYEPYRVVDPAGAIVVPVAVWFSELQALCRIEPELVQQVRDTVAQWDSSPAARLVTLLPVLDSLAGIAGAALPPVLPPTT